MTIYKSKTRDKQSKLNRVLTEYKIDEKGCWNWTGGKQPNGYGWLYLGLVDGKSTAGYPHRISYEIHKGFIPDGLNVCHKCDNPLCINPEHLFVGTDDDNHKDKVSKNRQIKGETHGGHKLTEQDVLNIRSEYRRDIYGCGYVALGNKYNVDKLTIKTIVDRVTWKHI